MILETIGYSARSNSVAAKVHRDVRGFAVSVHLLFDYKNCFVSASSIAQTQLMLCSVYTKDARSSTISVPREAILYLYSMAFVA